jgi:arginyl-tRNA synthetase
VIEKAAKEYAPQQIITYLLELAAAYNNFYANNKIVDATDPASPYRVTLTSAVNQALKNGLTVLGIPVPEKM